MGNANNHLIEYRTYDNIIISYLFWDMKGKNRFPEQPSDTQVNLMFQKCLQQIDASKTQLDLINQFNSKYKYRFVILHRRKIAQYKKQNDLKKISRQSYQLQIFKQVKTLQSTKKIKQLQILMKQVELNQTSIKTSLTNIDKYISEKCAQHEFIQIHGIQRFLELLNKANKLNKDGLKTSFSSQIEIMKFFRFFSLKYPKQFYVNLTKIKSYLHVVLNSYHPINSQLIVYCLTLMTDYIWKSQEGSQSLIQILQKHRSQANMSSFLSVFIESILQSDSILSVYYNIKFINQLITSVINKHEKQLLQSNLFQIKYSLVLQKVKIKLQTMQYRIQSTSFIEVYQKVFKYSQRQVNGYERNTMERGEKIKIDEIIEENSRNSKMNLNNLEEIHQQILLNMYNMSPNSQFSSSSSITSEISNAFMDENSQVFQQNNQIVCFLSETDRKAFNKFILKTLTQMQKFYKLQQYLQNQFFQQIIQQSAQNSQPTELVSSRLIQSRINDHNLQTYFNRIKKDSIKQKSNDILIKCFKKLQYFSVKQWGNLERFILEELGQISRVNQELEETKKKLEEKQALVKSLLKQNSQLKNRPIRKASEADTLNLKPTLLLPPPPPNLQEALKQSQSQTKTQFNQQSTTNQPLSLPNLLTLPIFNLNILLNKQQPKLKQKRNPVKPLKACNYTIISYQKIKNSIFENIDDSKVQINQDQLAQLFAKNNNDGPRQSNLRISMLENSRVILPPSTKQIIKILRPQRSRNIEIVLAKLKIPSGQIKKSLYSFSGRYTSQNVLQSIQKIIPTQQQQQLIKNYQGSEQDLAVSQKFYKQLIQIPQYTSRIKALIFSQIRQEMYFQIQSKFQQLEKGFTQLKNNTRMRCIVQNCLAIGNYLNGQNVKGGAWGFRIDTIQRLQEVKAGDNKMNAAFYLIKQVWKTFPYPIFQKQQIQIYQYLSRVPITQLFQQIKQLQKYLKHIQKAFLSKDPTNQLDQVSKFCSSIQSQLKQKFELFTSKKNQLQTDYISCAQYYCQDGKILSSQQFGKKIFQTIMFISNTQKLWKALEDKRFKEQSRRATRNNLQYIQPINPEISKDSSFAIDTRQQNISKTQKGFKKSKQINNNDNSEQILNSFINVQKAQNLLQKVTQEQRAKQIQQFQRQSLNKALQNALRRRTIKLQSINQRISKQMKTKNILQENQQNNQKTFTKRASNLNKIDFLDNLQEKR